VRSGNTYYGGMPWMNTPNPLDNYAAFLATSYNPTDHIEIGIKINAVPVPSTILLLGSCLAVLAGFRRKYRRG
jgi:hypothetical protein